MAGTGDRPDLSAARPWRRGRPYEAFTEGDVLHHHWGRTITEADAVLFATATLAHNPIYFNRPHARSLGHEGIVVDPFLVLCIAIGLSVEDLSERSEAFLGMDEVTFVRPVSVGDTILAESVVERCRPSRSKPGFGIVTWRTEARNQHDEAVLTLRRSNLFRLRDGRDAAE